MKTNSCFYKPAWTKFLTLSALMVILSALAFIGQPVISAHADGSGGFPTSTSTNTPVVLLPAALPTFTPVPPGSSGIQFPPTNTFTPGPIITVLPSGLNSNAIQGSNLPSAAVQQPPAGFSILSCWPFAIVAALIAAGVLWFVRNRTSKPMP